MGDLQIVYEKSKEVYLNNAIVDYSDKWYLKGFILKSPGLGILKNVMKIIG